MPYRWGKKKIRIKKWCDFNRSEFCLRLGNWALYGQPHEWGSSFGILQCVLWSPREAYVGIPTPFSCLLCRTHLYVNYLDIFLKIIPVPTKTTDPYYFNLMVAYLQWIHISAKITFICSHNYVKNKFKKKIIGQQKCLPSFRFQNASSVDVGQGPHHNVSAKNNGGWRKLCCPVGCRISWYFIRFVGAFIRVCHLWRRSESH